MQERKITPQEIAEKEIQLHILLKDHKPIRKPEMLVMFGTVRRIK